MGCSTTEEKIDINSGEKAYKEAKEYEDEERYEEAIRRYDEIKNKFCLDNNITLFRISYKENIEEKMLLIKKTFWKQKTLGKTPGVFYFKEKSVLFKKSLPRF